MFASAPEFLAREREAGPSCLVLDLRLPGMSGLDIQRELARTGTSIPIIFITGHGDIPTTVRAMKSGAVEFLTKPFGDQVLLDAIHQALERDRVARRQADELSALKVRYATLSRREREVMGLVVSGMTNEQIAGRLGTSEGHRQDSPLSGDAEDAGPFPGGAGEDGGAPRRDPRRRRAGGKVPGLPVMPEDD